MTRRWLLLLLSGWMGGCKSSDATVRVKYVAFLSEKVSRSRFDVVLSFPPLGTNRGFNGAAARGGGKRRRR
jgi:hypothetical protein